VGGRVGVFWVFGGGLGVWGGFLSLGVAGEEGVL